MIILKSARTRGFPERYRINFRCESGLMLDTRNYSIGQYKEEIKFGKIWGYQNKSPLKRAPNFLTFEPLNLDGSNFRNG